MEAFPAEILDQSYPSSRPHTAKHFSAGTELSGAVQHMLMLLVIRDDFNDTLMTNSIMVSVHVLQTRHCLMGYSLLCTAIAVVPYLPSSLASASFSFHYCLHSFADPCAPHSKHFQSGSSRLWSPPGVMQPVGWGCGKLLSSASLSSGAQEHGELLPWTGMHTCTYEASVRLDPKHFKDKIFHIWGVRHVIF